MLHVAPPASAFFAARPFLFATNDFTPNSFLNDLSSNGSFAIYDGWKR